MSKEYRAGTEFNELKCPPDQIGIIDSKPFLIFNFEWGWFEFEPVSSIVHEQDCMVSGGMEMHRRI